MNLHKSTDKISMNLDILGSSNGIYKEGVKYMRNKNNNTTNGFRNGAIIFFVIMIFALISHFLGNL